MINEQGNCQYCGSHIDAEHPYFIGQQIEKHMPYEGFEWWERIGDGRTVEVKNLGTVTVVAKHVSYGEDQGEDSRPIFIIFEVDGKYYRKSGIANSYGERNWGAGGFLPAVQKVVVTKVWEDAS